MADVLALYALNVAPSHARPGETAQRISALLSGLGGLMLSQVNGEVCRDYAAKCSSDSAARRQLEELRAAINHHRREGKCSQIVEVVLPQRRPGRERWLTRDEAARLIRHAWRHPERRHVAKFWLVALKTGSRAATILGATFAPTPGRAHVDLDNGVFYRKAAGKRVTKKRAPPVPLPAGLLAHLRRWRRAGQRHVVEFRGQPVDRVSKASNAAVRDAGLGRDVVPHIARHTCATWLMQAGVDPWEAAGYLGMTVETLTARYGHHHPEHLAGARRALD